MQKTAQIKPSISITTNIVPHKEINDKYYIVKNFSYGGENYL